MKTDYKPVCNKCGSIAEVDKEASNKNWTVYKMKEPCKCGGEYKIKMIYC